jgi:hypothetical protein
MKGICQRAICVTGPSLKTSLRSALRPCWSPSGPRASRSPEAISSCGCRTMPTSPWCSRYGRELFMLCLCLCYLCYALFLRYAYINNVLCVNVFACVYFTNLVFFGFLWIPLCVRIRYTCRVRRLRSGSGDSRTATTSTRPPSPWCSTNTPPCPSGASPCTCSGTYVCACVCMYV